MRRSRLLATIDTSANKVRKTLRYRLLKTLRGFRTETTVGFAKKYPEISEYMHDACRILYMTVVKLTFLFVVFPILCIVLLGNCLVDMVCKFKAKRRKKKSKKA